MCLRSYSVKLSIPARQQISLNIPDTLSTSRTEPVVLGKRNFGTGSFLFSKYSRTTAMCSRSSSASSGEISTSRAVPVFVWFLTWRPAMAFETLITIRPNLRSKGVRASASLGRMPVLASVMNRPEKIGACTSFLHPLLLIPAAF